MNISLDTRNDEHQRIEAEIQAWGGRVTVLPPKKKPKSRTKYTAEPSAAQAAFEYELQRLKA